MGIGPPFFMLGVLVPLNGWNQILVSFGSSVQVPALVLRHPPAPLFCVTFSPTSQFCITSSFRKNMHTARIVIFYWFFGQNKLKSRLKLQYDKHAGADLV